MKFTVKSLVDSVSSNALTEAEASTKEVEVQNPNAQLSSLRAKASVAFRLNLSGFVMVYKGVRASQVDLTDEKKVIGACGLEDGDNIVLVSKSVREGNGSEVADTPAEKAPPTAPASTAASTFGAVAAAAGESEANAVAEPRRKAPRVEDTDDEGDDDPFAEAEASAEDDEEGDIDLDLNATAVAAMLGDSADAAAGELYSRLLETVPNLVQLREEFLTNPQAVMERIQREDPALFQLITSHQEAFISLINNESVIATIQAEKDDGFYDDEELDEETMANMLGLLAGADMGDDGDEEDYEGVEGIELGLEDLAALQAGDNGGKEVKDRILAFAPSEEDDQKIQQLTQLGFAYDVCKVAFYLSHRSLERAANMLFESPPQL